MSEKKLVIVSALVLVDQDGRVLICPQNAVFEIKLPESDIKGTVK